MEKLFAVSTARDDFARPGASVRITAKMGVHVKLKNGTTVSVQWGPTNYGSNHGTGGDFSLLRRVPEGGLPDATTAEVAAWDAHDRYFELAPGLVLGYQNWDEVQAVIDRAERGELRYEEPEEDEDD